MIAENRIVAQIDGEDRGLILDQLLQDVAAVAEVNLGVGIDSAEHGPLHAARPDVMRFDLADQREILYGLHRDVPHTNDRRLRCGTRCYPLSDSSKINQNPLHTL